jgi:hypothetical protein
MSMEGNAPVGAKRFVDVVLIWKGVGRRTYGALNPAEEMMQLVAEGAYHLAVLSMVLCDVEERPMSVVTASEATARRHSRGISVKRSWLDLDVAPGV